MRSWSSLRISRVCALARCMCFSSLDVQRMLPPALARCEGSGRDSRSDELADRADKLCLGRVVGQKRALDVRLLRAVVTQVVEVLDPCQMQTVGGQLVRLRDGRPEEQAVHLGALGLDVRLDAIG